MTGRLREGDADAMIQVLQEAREDAEDTEAAPWALLEGLQRLVPCDLDVAFQHHDFAHRRTELIQAVDLDGRRWLDHPAEDGWGDDGFWDLFWDDSCSWPQRTGDLRSVVTTDDFHPTERDRRAAPLADVLVDVRSCMTVSLPAEPGHARRFTFMRRSAGFDERDRELLSLLRPHLHELMLDAERRRAGVPGLTAREWQVLALVGCGLSYAEVARRLFLSPATVRKHMEHVRQRLGVGSAAAAVAVAMPHAPAACSRLVPAARRPGQPRRRQAFLPGVQGGVSARGTGSLGSMPSPLDTPRNRRPIQGPR